MGIIIEWPEGIIEYLDDVDPDDLDVLEPFDTTKEWWPREEKFCEYRVETNIERSNDGVVVVVMYAWNQNQENPDLRGLDDACWGKNRIFIERGKDHGKYSWQAENGETFESQWKTKRLREPRNPRRSPQQIRDEKFRPQILALDDGKCVISGETTKEALDAAHIVPAAEDGNEIPENGIALRADIHRLYDARMFVIHPKTGRPKKIAPDLSETYKELLERSRLPDNTRERVNRALKEVWREMISLRWNPQDPNRA